ncbi:unnamed protein product [Spodoptera littoralis]|uniref:Galectin n=1 Tax=Spodoptera littoralis TaxID=7109 RepID=A0A9P0N6U4_SPOLI|nr:unnamed protein product [Spodoptera littoralis]CAH1641945.1 unnamed protein product [Spodoptera littoralis]
MVEGDVTIDEISFVGAHLPQDLNLGIPSTNLIPGGIFPGRIVKVKGGTTLASKRFSVNLQCGPKMYPGEDIAFHFNPRFDTNILVRNHYAGSKWGTEETSSGVPMNKGECFEILIYCYYYRFKVEVNGKCVCEFNHHIPFGKITHIMVEGDLTIDEISFVGAHPPQDPNLKVPFAVPILGCMQPGRWIRVKGTTPAGGERFAINLQCGPKLYPDEEIAFSFSPRFNQGNIVLNHFGCSKWGHEVTEGPLPLSSGSPFEFYIYCYQNSFKVLLNEQQVCEFTHRLPIQRITHVMVDGDAMIFELDYDSPEHPCGPPPSSGSGEISGPY